MEPIYRTGNETVDEISRMEITGNVIPSAWYRTIRRETGKPYLNAIVILSDIVYWYRAAEVRDQESGEIVRCQKRFKADILQRSYQQIAEQFGISKRDATNAIVALEKLGVVKRVFRKLRVDRFVIPNVMFLALDVEVLKRLTFPDGEESGDDGRGKREVMGQDSEIVGETREVEIWEGGEIERANEAGKESVGRAVKGEDGTGAETEKGKENEDSDSMVAGENCGKAAGNGKETEELTDCKKRGGGETENRDYVKLRDTSENGGEERHRVGQRHEGARWDSLGYQMAGFGQDGGLLCPKGRLPFERDTTGTGEGQRKNGPVDTAHMRQTNTEITYKDYNRDSLILSCSSYQETKEEFKRQIEYDILKHDLGDTGELDELVEIASEILTSRADTIRVNREERQAVEVKERYRRLTMIHVQYVLHCLSETASRIRNIRAVMITALYNASSTISTYYGNLYRNHGFGAA